MTTVLVTGATGNVGRHVVRELVGRGVAVRAFVRDPAKAPGLGAGVELVPGDFGDPESIRTAIKGADAVLLSCGNHPRQLEYETNAIDVAAAAGTQRLVKLSSIGARVGARLGFWDWHGRIEQHLQDSGIPATVLASNFYMTNVLASADTLRQAGKLFAPAAGARVAMIDPRDTAAVAALTLTQDGHAGRKYTLSGPAAITFEEVAAGLTAALGRPVEFVPVPDDAARGALAAAGLPDWLVANTVTLFGLLRGGAGAEVTGEVRRLTGREPRSFAEFARDHAAAFAG